METMVFSVQLLGHQNQHENCLIFFIDAVNFDGPVYLPPSMQKL